MSAVSSQFSVSIASNSAPAWFTALSHKQWASPVTNWIGAVAPASPGGSTGHLSVLGAWCGMGIDQTRKMMFMLHNGGHNDYYGNEVYSCDLTLASPAWVRRRNPSTASGSGNIAKFSDGRPCSDHTTNLTIEAEGRWFTPGMSSTNYVGSANYNQWWEYKPFSGTGTISGAADDWVDLGNTHASNGLSVAGLALWDSFDRQVLVFHNNNTSPSVEFQSIDNMSGAAALTNTQPLAMGGGMMGSIDTTNRIVLVRWNSTYYYLKLTNNTTKQAAWSSVSVSGTEPPNTYQMHWHAPSNAFITWDGASGLRKLTPTVSGGGYTSATWSAVAGAGGVTPLSGSLLMYNKINIVQNMGDGTSALVIVSRYANPDTYVMRLTGAV